MPIEASSSASSRSSWVRVKVRVRVRVRVWVRLGLGLRLGLANLVVAGAQHAVDEVGHDPGVVAVSRQHVDGGGLGAQLLPGVGEADGLALGVEELDPRQADVVGVAPAWG